MFFGIIIVKGGVSVSVYTIDQIKELVKPVAKMHGFEKICLFGSYARDEATENRDDDFIANRGAYNSFI